MTRSLHQLVSDDLLTLDNNTDFIPSSQVSNLIIKAFINSPEGALPPCQRIKLSGLPSDSELIFSPIQALAEKSQKTLGVHQLRLFLEKGSRSLSSLHYFAGYVEAEMGKVKVLIIDQSIGYDTLQAARDRLTDGELDLDYYVAGGVTLQKDYTNCLFFTLSSLNEVPHIPNLFADLEQCTLDVDNKENASENDIISHNSSSENNKQENLPSPAYRKIHWLDMPPQLVWNGQSFSFILGYIDHLKQKHAPNCPDHIPVLAQPLRHGSLNFAQHIAEGISLKGDKVLVDCIRRLVVSYYASLGFNTQENIEDVDDLIDIIYQKDMSKINTIMHQLVKVEEYTNHDLFELFYLQPEKYEKALENATFYKLCSDERVHHLLHRVPGLAAELMSVCNALGALNKHALNTIIKNLIIVPVLINLLDEGTITPDPTIVKQILMHNLGKALLTTPVILELMRARCLGIESALNVIPIKIKEDVLTRCGTLDEKLAYVESRAVSPNHPKHKRKISADLGASLKEVLNPTVLTVSSISNFSPEKVESGVFVSQGLGCFS